MTWRPEDPPSRWLTFLPRRFHKFVLLAMLVGGLGLVVASGFVLHYSALASRYDISEVGKLPRPNQVYDRNNQEIEAVVGPAIDRVDFDDLPPFLVKALLAREDKDFFTHSGVDVRGLMRATLRNLKDREFTQGASTLSMQLARNTYDIRAKSLHRKFLEIALTLRVEDAYTKEQIFAGYLNRIYFGVGAGHLGIRDAAKHYFGKAVKDLNEAECAMLVGIIRGPHIFSPWRDREAAVSQRDQVLDRMVALEFITPEERRRIRELPLQITRPDEVSTEQSYALQAVVREVNKLVSAEDMQRGGLKIFTTLDMPWQRRLESEMKKALLSLESEAGYPSPTFVQHQGKQNPLYLQMSAITLETKTGAILARIGGRHFEHSRFDRSNTARRDLGSAFEPFVAASAAERGLPIYPGSPVATGKPVGPEAVEETARRCGFTGPFLRTEDLYRGAVSATPLELATGLATLANAGKRSQPFLIREIRDAENKVVASAEQRFFQVLDPKASRAALGVLRQATGTDTFTGATGSEREAWTLRLGPRGSTAIWVGFDQPREIVREDRLNKLLSDIVLRLDNQ